jgi:hypothetical protein
MVVPAKSTGKITAAITLLLLLASKPYCIKGTEQITYVNNSPDTLKRLNMKLILNIHKPGAARFGDAGADYLTTGIQFDSFLINGEAKKVNFWLNQSMVGLGKPLMPHDSVKLDIGWHFQISKKAGARA